MNCNSIFHSLCEEPTIRRRTEILLQVSALRINKIQEEIEERKKKHRTLGILFHDDLRSALYECPPVSEKLFCQESVLIFFSVKANQPDFFKIFDALCICTDSASMTYIQG